MAGAYRTQTDLVLETLANLGVLAAGQNPDVEDVQYVTEKLDAIFRMLAGLDICYIPDPNNIPGAFFSPLADIVAGDCATKFGSSPDDFAKLTQKGLGVPPGSGAAAMALKQITRGRPTFEPLRVQYF
jgi:hypothetical protein